MIRVIHNPVAGPRMVRKIDRVREILSAGEIPFEICKTTGPGGAVILARGGAHARKGGGEALSACGLRRVRRRGAGADGRPGQALPRHRSVFPGGGETSPPRTAEPLDGNAGEGAGGGGGRRRLSGGEKEG